MIKTTLLAVIIATGAAASVSAQNVTIASGPSGGTFEVASAAAAEIFKRSDDFADVNVNIIPGGTEANINLLLMGRADVGIVSSDLIHATGGESLRGMIALYPNTLQVWATANSEVSDLGDLRGKRFTYGIPGSGPYQIGGNLLDLYGVSDEVRVQPLSWGAANDAIRDNNLDAILWTTSYPQATMVETMQTRDIRLLQLAPEMLAAYREQYPGWMDITIPAGTYPNQDSDVTTLATVLYFAVNPSMSDDQVYAMTKALYENRGDMQNAHRLMGYISADTAAQGMGIPLHPGARRYYEESGVPVE